MTDNNNGEIKPEAGKQRRDSKRVSWADPQPLVDARWTFRRRTHLTLAGVVVFLAPLLSLPPFHPILVHLLFWPSLAIVLTLPTITLANIRNIQIFRKKQQKEMSISPAARRVNSFLLPFFLCNLVGVVCSRSVHVQFYSWYFYSLHFLLCHTSYSTKFRLLLLRYSRITLSYHNVL